DRLDVADRSVGDIGEMEVDATVQPESVLAATAVEADEGAVGNGEHVVAGAAIENVPAAAAHECVVAEAADQALVGTRTLQQIVKVRPELIDGVAEIAAVDHV